jgi:hypothetical protein
MKILLVLLLLVAPALAGDEPWSAGVSDAKKKAAQALLEQGNTLFLDKQFSAALEKYKEAVAQWDHPAIRFNMVRCLIQLEKPVEASENLARALAYGAAPLDDTVYGEALNYQKLLAKQIGDLEVSCTQAGVKVSFDGQTLITCPGSAKRRAIVGAHQLVGTKDGFLTKTIEVIVPGGTEKKLSMSLIPLASAAKIAHRWPTWVPWSVFGGGLAIAGLGGLIQLQSNARMDSYDRQVARNCSLVHCDPNDPTMLDASDKESAERLNSIAIGVISVGAGVAIAGGVMLYLNRGRTVYENSTEKAARVDVVPQRGGGLVTLGVRF